MTSLLTFRFSLVLHVSLCLPHFPQFRVVPSAVHTFQLCHQRNRAPTCSSFLKFAVVVQTSLPLPQTYSSGSELSQSSAFPLSFSKCFYFITQSVTISTAEARPLFFSPPSGHALKQKLLKFHLHQLHKPCQTLITYWKCEQKSSLSIPAELYNVLIPSSLLLGTDLEP